MQEHLLARGFLTASERAAEHHGGGASHKGLGDVTGVVDATVGDAGHASGTAGLSGLVHGGELRNANTGNDTGGADGARTNTDLDGIGTGLDHGLGTGTGADVAADDLHAIEGGIVLQAGDHVECQAGLTVGGVDHEHIHAGLHQGGGTLPCVAEEADAGGHAQTTLLILGGVRVLFSLDEVLDRDQTSQMTFRINQRQLLNLVLGEQAVGVVLGDVGRTGDQVLLGHDILDLQGVVILGGDETHITVGDDADELVVLVHHRQTGDVELAAQLVEISQSDLRVDGQRIGNHTGLGALDHIDLSSLIVDGQVAVQHADTTVTSHGDGHLGLGHGIHGGGEHRGLHRDIAGQMGAGVHFGRNDIRLVRQQQHIIIGKAELGENRGKGGIRRLGV